MCVALLRAPLTTSSLQCSKRHHHGCTLHQATTLLMCRTASTTSSSQCATPCSNPKPSIATFSRLQGGVDHFQLAMRNAAPRLKSPARERLTTHLEKFWDRLVATGHAAEGVDVLEVLNPIGDFCVLLCGCDTSVGFTLCSDATILC